MAETHRRIRRTRSGLRAEAATFSRAVPLLLAAALLGSAWLAAASSPEKVGSVRIDERRYCTRVGPMLIRFDRAKAAGFYAIVPNGHLGTFVGILDGTRSSESGGIRGEWHEADSSGEIEIRTEDAWKSFVARYSVGSEGSRRWHEGWRGREQPADRPESFEHGGERYLCERPPGSP